MNTEPGRNAALALAVLADATAETAREQAVSARTALEAEAQAARERSAEQQRRQREADAAGQRAAARRRAGSDASAASLAVAAAVTVLVPYLIGHFLLRRTFVLRPSDAVYEPQVRGLLDHVVPDYIGGVTVLTALLAVFLLIRPWAYRTRSVVAGWSLVAAVLVLLLPMTMSQWSAAEQRTVNALRETAFPFAERYLQCASWEFDTFQPPFESVRELWQVHLGQMQNSVDEGCNRVIVYRGWREAGMYTIDNADTFTGEIVVNTPNWQHPFVAQSSSSIYQLDGRRLDPGTVSVELATRSGRQLRFVLGDAGSTTAYTLE